jgi:hypothetical protein
VRVRKFTETVTAQEVLVNAIILIALIVAMIFAVLSTPVKKLIIIVPVGHVPLNMW